MQGAVPEARFPVSVRLHLSEAARSQHPDLLYKKYRSEHSPPEYSWKRKGQKPAVVPAPVCHSAWPAKKNSA